MALAVEARPIPLQIEENGTIRIIGTRIPLDTVIYAYLNGSSAEDIVESFATLNLSDVYAIISYYLDHRQEVDNYLRARQAEGHILRGQLEAQFPSRGIRDRLLARQRNHAQTGS
jgi:uncharacterized protein (DUF433 family)